MSAIKDFPEELWVKDVNKLTSGRIAGLILREKLPALFPEVFRGEIKITTCRAQGWSNISVIVGNSEGREFLVRIRAREAGSGAGKFWAPYHKEEFAIGLVRPDLPVPAPLDNSIAYFNIEGVPRFGSCDLCCWVQNYVNFDNAQGLTDPAKRIRLMKNAGAMAAKLHSVKVRGFGTGYDHAERSFADPDWRTFLSRRIEHLEMDLIAKNSFLERSVIGKVFNRISDLMDLKFEPSLFHNDFISNWGNILVDDDMNIRALIDWEFCGGGPAAEYEIASGLYVMHRDKMPGEQIDREFSALLEGYGISRDEYEERLKRSVESFVIINSLEAISKYIRLVLSDSLDREPWRKDFFHTAVSLINRLA